MEDSKITEQKYHFVCFRCGCIIKTGEKMVSLSVSVETPTEDGGLESSDATAISTLCSGCASVLLSKAIVSDPKLMMPRGQEPEDDEIEEIDEDETEDEIDTDFSYFKNIDDMFETVYYGDPSEEDDDVNTGKGEEDEPRRRLRIRCSSKGFRLVLDYWKRVSKATSQLFTPHQRDIAQMNKNNRKHRNVTGQGGYGKMSPAEVYFALGQHFLKEEDWEGAINAFTSYIELESDNPLAYDRRGIAYGRAERYDEAIADFNRAINLEPAFAGAYSNRGLSCYKQYRFDEAIADYYTAIQLSPGVAVFYANRGLAHSQKGDLHAAIVDCDRAIELDPTLLETHNNRGEAYAELGQYEKALADFEHELTLNPNDIVAYANRVWAAAVSDDCLKREQNHYEKGDA
jgi:tetratricopeptide (TPR) repeat protein